MACQYFPIFWLFFVHLSWKFSNAAVPNWCKDPMPVRMYLLISPQTDAVNFESSDGIFVYFCQFDMTEFYNEENKLKLFRIWNPANEGTLFYFLIVDINFNYMSGNTFWIKATESDGNISVLKGKFENFNDFKRFHSFVEGEDAKYSPQNFTIVGLESYENVCNSIWDDIKIVHPQPAIFSQYLIENSDQFGFSIEDAKESYLTFQPYQYRSTRNQIESQVVLTRSNDINKYFILCFGTPENALNFASYIGKFALPESLPIPDILEEFLIGRG